MALTFDIMQAPAKLSGAIARDIPLDILSMGGRRAQKALAGVRPVARNTKRKRDQTVAPTEPSENVHSHYLSPQLILPALSGNPGNTQFWQVMMFGGCSAHLTLSYLKGPIVHVFRKVFEAVLALLPNGTYCVTGVKINQLVRPCAEIPHANSYIIELVERVKSHYMQYFGLWVGEF